DDVRRKIREQYRRSLDRGLWKGAYAGTNEGEFFAELTMWYVGTHGDLHMEGPKPENGAEGLRKYDPEAYSLLDDLYSGRIPVGRVKLAELKPLPPDQEKTLRSGEGKEPSRIRFLNRSGRELKLYWIDAEGRRQARGSIPAGGSLSQRTFAAHVWLLADADDHAVALFVAGADRGLAPNPEADCP